MSDLSFKLMSLTFDVIDLFFPYIDKRVKNFGIQGGMTVVDYGCGPGRYTERFVKLVGETGKVYAVDIHEMAIETIRRKTDKYAWRNVVPLLGGQLDLSPLILIVLCQLVLLLPVAWLEQALLHGGF